MNFLDADVAGYLRQRCAILDDPVLNEMEAEGEARRFPIVGRVVGAALEVLARGIGARRVFEMGSGYGFSAYWFARAVGPEGEVFLTDTDPANADLAHSYLERAGLWGRCRFLVNDAIEALGATEGEFDAIYCDIDKGDYPAAFEQARGRIRVGGIYLADNVLWSGRVARSDDDEWTSAIRRHNEQINADPDYLSFILPIRDGVMAALRVR